MVLRVRLLENVMEQDARRSGAVWPMQSKSFRAEDVGATQSHLPDCSPAGRPKATEGRRPLRREAQSS